MNEESGETRNRGKKGVVWLAAIPLAVFLLLAVIFMKQLYAGGSTSEIPSVLIGKPAPALDLPPLEGLVAQDGQLPGIASGMLEGKTSVINVWASWCVPCRAEHPLMERLGNDPRFQLLGVNYKDQAGNALRFLGQLGNPYDAVGVDLRGKAAIDWGVYGVPETFIVDPEGKVRYKHVGPLTEEGLREKFLPELEKSIGAPRS